MSSNTIKSFRGFLQQETLPSMISTGLFQGKDLRTIYITRISLSNENELPVL